MATVSARPENLAAYCSRLEAVDRDLQSTAGSLLQTLETYRARCPKFGADHTALAHELDVYAAQMEQLDWWVGRVGEAFRQADRAPGPVPSGVVLSTEEAVEAARERIEPQTEELVPEGGFDAVDIAILIADLAGIVDPTPISDGASGVISLFKGDWTAAGLSAASMIPYLGDGVAKPAKILKAFHKAFPALMRIGKIEDILNVLRIKNFGDLLVALKNPARLKSINDTLATLNRIHRDAKKVYENTRWLQKAKDLNLPTEGPIVFVPPKNWDPSKPLRGRAQNGAVGYLDRYGNVWPKGSGRGGDHFEWDVQRPKDKPNAPSPLVDRMSTDGKHVNVGNDGRITH